MKKMDQEKSHIACIGILCADIMGKTIDQLAEKGKLSLVDSISLHAGGCAANVAMALSKIGLPPAIIGKVGDDSLGNYLINTLKNESINVEGLQIDSQVSTSASMVMISDDGERTIIHSLGANKEFSYDSIDLEIISRSKILLIAGTFLMPSFDGEGTVKLLKFANEKGVLCCLDTAWDASGQWMSKIENSLAYLDWFMPSYDEAVKLTGQTNPHDIAEDFIQRGVKNVVIKLSNKGCFIKPALEQGYMVPSFSNVQVIDCSGAGDSFCAGFIAGLSMGWDIRKCAVFANAVGAHCVMEIGTTTGIKSMAEILKFIDQYGEGYSIQ